MSSLRLKGHIGRFSVVRSRGCVLGRVLEVVSGRTPSKILLTKSLCSEPIPSTRTIRLFSQFLARLTREGVPICTVDKGRSDTREVTFNSRVVDDDKVYVAPMCSKGARGCYLASDCKRI